MLRYSVAELNDLQAHREVWWPEAGTRWRETATGQSVTVVATAVDRQLGEWVVVYEGPPGRVWVQTLRSWYAHDAFKELRK